MRRNGLFLALLLSVGMNFGLVGMGIARHRMREAAQGEDRRPVRDGSRLADRLDLEGEERESFLRLQRDLAERVRAGRRHLEDSRRKLRQELTSPAPDTVRIEELLLDLRREQDALDRALVANVLAARELLDGPAQREYLRFVERLGAAATGPRSGPLRGGPRPRIDGR